MVDDFLEDWQHIILDWIEITVDMRTFDKLINKLILSLRSCLNTLWMNFLEKMFRMMNLKVLKSMGSLDDPENQASLLLDFAESQIHKSNF